MTTPRPTLGERPSLGSSPRAVLAIVVLALSATILVALVPPAPPTLQLVLLWVAVLATLFLLFLLLAYLDVLPRGRPVIDDVFLIHNSGVLICHYSTTPRPDVDSDGASGMLVAARDFAADPLGSKSGSFKEFHYRDYRVAMAHGEHVILVVFARGGSAKRLSQTMRAVLRTIEVLYERTLEASSGSIQDLTGVGEVLLKLVET